MTKKGQPIPVPVVTDHYVNIYKPQEDIYTLPTKRVRGRGHCFGISVAPLAWKEGKRSQ